MSAITIRRLRLAALLSFLLLVAASVAVTFWALRAQQSDALVINLAGRQRMLTQKMTLQVLGVQIGTSPVYREQLRITEYVYFEPTLNALIAGGEVPYTDDTTVTLPPTHDPEILAQLETVLATWVEMDAAIHVVLKEDPQSATFAEAVAAVERLSPVFLAQMDRAVRMYEAEAARKVARVQTIQIGFLAAAAALLVVAFFLTERWVLTSIDLLRAAARRIGAGDLGTPVSVAGPGEINRLAHRLDEMRRSLAASRGELERWARELDDRVIARTQEIAALGAIAQAANRHTEIKPLLDEALPLLCETIGASAAWVTLLDEDIAMSGETSEVSKDLGGLPGGGNFVLAGAHNLPPALEAGDRAGMRWPGCACQRKLLAGELTAAANIVECERLQQAQGDTRGLRYHATVPLRVGGRALGNLNLSTPADRAFDDDELRLLSAVGDQIDVVIERARLYEAERQQTAELTRSNALITALGRVAAQIETTPDPDQVLETLGAELERLGMTCLVALLEPDAQALVIRYDSVESKTLALAEKLTGLKMRGFRLPRERYPFFTEIVEQGRAVFIPDSMPSAVALMPGFPKPLVERAVRLVGLTPQARTIHLPLTVKEQVMGALAVWGEDLQQDDLPALSVFASQVAAALEVARLHEQVKERHIEEQAALLRLSKALSGETDTQAMVDLTVRVAAQALKVEFAAIALVDEDGQSYSGRAGVGWPPEVLHQAQRIPIAANTGLGYAIHTRAPVVIPNEARETRFGVPPWVTQMGITSSLLVPMVTSERVIGSMVVNSRAARNWSDDDVRLLSLIANDAAQALERAGLFEATRRQLEELTTLHAVTVAGTEEDSEDTLIERVTRIIGETLYPDNFGVLLLNEATSVLRVHPSYRGMREETVKLTFPLGHGVVGTVAARGQSWRVPDVKREPKYLDVNPDMRSELCVPLKVGERVIGAINAESTRLDAFTEADERLLTTFAGQLATAIEKVRLFAGERAAREQAETLREVAGALNASLDREQVLQLILEQLARVVDYDSASVMLVSDQALDIVSHRGFLSENQQFAPLQVDALQHVQEVLEECHSIIIPDTTADPRWWRLPGSEYIRCWLGVPLVVQDRVIGLLNLDKEQAGFYTERDAELAAAFADQAAIAIENARLFEETRHRAEELEALVKVSSSLRQAQTREDMLPILVEKTAEVLQADASALLLREGDTLILAAAHGQKAVTLGHQHPSGDDPLWRVARTGEPMFVPDVSGHSEFNQWEIFRELMAGQTACACIPLKTAAATVGLLHLACRSRREVTEEERRLLTAIAEMAGNALHRARAHEELEEGYLQTVLALAKAMDARDSYTGDHSQRLAVWTEATARELGCSSEEIETIEWGALLHDIGKIGVPDAILRKPGPLTEEEWAIMKRHPELGAEIVEPVRRLADVAPIIHAHQEKYDGSGYPDGLQGTEIPLGARILAVVDAYGAITDERVYRKARGHAEAVAELRRCAGTHFDPQVVAAFLDVIRET